MSSIDALEVLIKDRYLPRLRLHVAERKGRILGFIGMHGPHVAMLFVADEVRSTGVGSPLVDWAKGQGPRGKGPG